MDFILNLLPKWLKVTLGLILLAIIAPIQLYRKAQDFVQAEVHATITPMKEVRDQQILTMQNDIADIKQDTRDIRNHLMGKSPSENK